MSLTAAVGSLPTSIPATTTPHRHHHHFGGNMQQASQATAQAGATAASTAASGSGQLLSNDLLQQISALTGQAPAGSVVTG